VEKRRRADGHTLGCITVEYCNLYLVCEGQSDDQQQIVYLEDRIKREIGLLKEIQKTKKEVTLSSKGWYI